VRFLPVTLALALAGCSASNDIPSPLIASIVPDHGTPGAIVTIAGSYFCQLPDVNPDDPTCPPAGTVNFGTLPATTTTWADDAIMVEVPQGPPSRPSVTVTASGRISNAIAFTID
jgi:IPT/TIG domain